MQQISDPDQLRVKIQHCNNDMNQLCNSLMALEFQLVTQLEVGVAKHVSIFNILLRLKDLNYVT